MPRFFLLKDFQGKVLVDRYNHLKSLHFNSTLNSLIKRQTRMSPTDYKKKHGVSITPCCIITLLILRYLLLISE